MTKGGQIQLAIAAGAMLVALLLNVWVATSTIEIGPIFHPTSQPAWGEGKRAPGATTAARDFSAILDRPIFVPSRRPPPVEAPTSSPATPPTPPPLAAHQFKVAGIFISNTSKKVLIQAPSEPEGHWLTEGSQFHGWLIAKILPGGLVVQRESQQVELKLHRDTPSR